MKEPAIRKYHRTVGGIIAIFAVLQVGTGIILTCEQIAGMNDFTPLVSILHAGGEGFGEIYRILLGVSLAFMAATGVTILMMMRARTKKKKEA
jgi:hypothetical protein